MSRFMPKLAKYSLPFFEDTKRREGFVWTLECQETFKHFKAYLSSAPMLCKPEKGEALYLYLGVAAAAVSSVFLRE